jgi:BASS family bile acid:Na+ symporter
MVAATDGVLPGTTWLYFALSQFPIYLSPQLLKPLVARLSAAASTPGRHDDGGEQPGGKKSLSLGG